jgi:hypothetical protein
MYLSLAKGGEIEKSNNEMLQSQLKAVEHHAKELSSIVTNKTPIEAWVVGKIERAETDLSDITHYLDGAKFERGGEVVKMDVIDILRNLHKFSNEIKFRVMEVNGYYNIVYDDPKGVTQDCLNNLKNRKFMNTGFDAVIGKFGSRVNIVFEKSAQIILNIQEFDKKDWSPKKYADGGMMAMGGGVDIIGKCKAIKTIKFKNGLNYFEGFTYPFEFNSNSVSVSYDDGRFTTMSKEVFDNNFEKLATDGGQVPKNYIVEYEIDGVKHTSTYLLYPNDRVENLLPSIAKIISIKEKMAMGGKVTFNDKVKAIEKNLVGKKVPTKFKRQYGQKYNEKEAHEAATNIAGSMLKK